MSLNPNAFTSVWEEFLFMRSERSKLSMDKEGVIAK